MNERNKTKTHAGAALVKTERPRRGKRFTKKEAPAWLARCSDERREMLTPPPRK